MTDTYAQVFPNSTGEKIDAEGLTVGSNNVIRQRVVLADHSDTAGKARVKATVPDQGDYGLTTRPVPNKAGVFDTYHALSGVIAGETATPGTKALMMLYHQDTETSKAYYLMLVRAWLRGSTAGKTRVQLREISAYDGAGATAVTPVKADPDSGAATAEVKITPTNDPTFASDGPYGSAMMAVGAGVVTEAVLYEWDPSSAKKPLRLKKSVDRGFCVTQEVDATLTGTPDIEVEMVWIEVAE